MRAPVPARGPQAEKEEKEREGKEGNGDARSSREPESQKQESQRAGSATDGLCLYIGTPFPARGARGEAEIGAGGLVVCSLGGFWACGSRSPPEGPKQRRRERERKATGTPEAAEPESQRGSPRECNRRAFPIYRGPVPGKGRPERSRDWSRRVGCLFFGWLLGLRAPVPARGPQAEKEEKEREEKQGNGDAGSSREPESQKQQSQRAREEAQGSATDGLCLYIGAPFPARGARREAEIGAGGLVVSTLGGFWACGPRSPPEGPKQRRRRRRERERKPTGTPEAAEPESQRGSPRECNRRAFPIYRGPVPGKGRPERSRDWSRRVGCLYFGWLLGLRAPVLVRGPQAEKEEKEREEKQGNGTPEAAEPESQKQQSQRAREEAQGSETDELFLYIGAPFPARGARREAEIGAGGLVVSTLGGFWACGPRSPPEGPKQRRRERERKATGTPEAAEPESQRGSPRECNRRAFPIYRGPVPGKGRPERSRLEPGTPEAAEPESQRGSPRECNRRAFPIYRGPVPGKGRPERSRDWSRRVGGL